MSKSFALAFAVLGLAAVPATLPTVQANAAIVCKDGFQKSGGSWISTPYCNDARLAEIARKRGMTVSDAEIRQNPARKYEVCRLVGNAGAGKEYCPDEGGRDWGGR